MGTRLSALRAAAAGAAAAAAASSSSVRVVAAERQQQRQPQNPPQPPLLAPDCGCSSSSSGMTVLLAWGDRGFRGAVREVTVRWPQQQLPLQHGGGGGGSSLVAAEVVLYEFPGWTPKFAATVFGVAGAVAVVKVPLLLPLQHGGRRSAVAVFSVAEVAADVAVAEEAAVAASLGGDGHSGNVIIAAAAAAAADVVVVVSANGDEEAAAVAAAAAPDGTTEVLRVVASACPPWPPPVETRVEEVDTAVPERAVAVFVSIPHQAAAILGTAEHHLVRAVGRTSAATVFLAAPGLLLARSGAPPPDPALPPRRGVHIVVATVGEPAAPPVTLFAFAPAAADAAAPSTR